jgi:hypothetical protein
MDFLIGANPTIVTTTRHNASVVTQQVAYRVFRIINFPYFKNALASYYNAGVVVVNSALGANPTTFVYTAATPAL